MVRVRYLVEMYSFDWQSVFISFGKSVLPHLGKYVSHCIFWMDSSIFLILGDWLMIFSLLSQWYHNVTQDKSMRALWDFFPTGSGGNNLFFLVTKLRRNEPGANVTLLIAKGNFSQVKCADVQRETEMRDRGYQF